MRVFRRGAESRTADEPAFRPVRAPAAPDRDDATGFEERRPTVRFRDVAGLSDVVEELRDIVGYVGDAQRYEALGARPPTGILLFGDPGCGKTLLGRALAGEAGVPFYFVSATSFVERFVGLGASRIRELFDTASRDAPCIVFLDELDAVGRQRTDAAGDREFDHTLNQLLVELDGFLGARGVITVAATNRPDLLDSALVRPGRFDRHIEVPRPDGDGRLAVLRLHAAGRPCTPDVDWTKVAEATEGSSPAELAGLVNEAALLAARAGADAIGWREVERALDRHAGGGCGSRQDSADTLARRAAHEVGHAVVALSRRDARPPTRLSVGGCARRDAWSARREIATGQQLLTDLLVLLGGHAGEQVLTGAPSTLGEADLGAAARLAARITAAGLTTGDVPADTDALLAWAHEEAVRIVAARAAEADSLVVALRTNRALFLDEVRALATPSA